MEDIVSDTSSDGESNPDDEPVLRRSSHLVNLNITVQPTVAVKQDDKTFCFLHFFLDILHLAM